MPKVQIKASDGKTLEIPFSGAPPSDAKIDEVRHTYEASLAAKKAAPAPSLFQSIANAVTSTAPLAKVPPRPRASIGGAAGIHAQPHAPRNSFVGNVQAGASIVRHSPAGRFIEKKAIPDVVNTVSGLGDTILNLTGNNPAQFTAPNARSAGALAVNSQRATAKAIPAGLLAASGQGTDPNDHNSQILYNLANALGAQAGGQKGALYSYAKGVPAGIIENTKQHPFQQALNALPFALKGAGAVAGAADTARGLSKTIEGMDLQPRGLPPQLSHTKPTVRAGSRGGVAPKVAPNIAPVAPAQPPHVIAPAPTPEVAPAALVEPKSATPAKSAPTMAGSVNLDNLDTTSEAKARLAQSGDSAQTVAPTTHAQIEKDADALNLTPEHLKGVTPGEVPSGVHPAAFDTAVRKLNVAKQEQTTSADAAYQTDKTPDNLDALTKANQEAHAVLQHAQARARVSGQTLSAYNVQASAFEGALEKTQGKQQALARTSALTDPNAPLPTPRAKNYGANNTIVTNDARDAALARLKAATQQLNSGIDPAVLKDAGIVGLYHIEAGLREFGAWAKQMASDVPGLSDVDLHRVYASARAEYADKAKGNLKQTGQLVFADALAPRLGRQGVSDFMGELADGPHSDLLGKVIRGENLAPDERQFVNDTYRAHLPARSGKVAPSQQSLAALNAVTKEFADANRRANLSKGRPGGDPLTNTLRGRLGVQNVPEFLKRLAGDPNAHGVEVKLRAGQDLTDAEKRAVAVQLDNLKRPARSSQPSDVSKMLTGIVRDAKAGRLGYPDAKAAVREELLGAVDASKVPEITKALAGVQDGDFKGLANIYSRYYPARLLDKARQMQQASLLSGPKTLGSIAIAHAASAGVEEGLVRPLAAAVNRGKVQGINAHASMAMMKALKDAVPETARLMTEGPTSMQLRGMSPGFRVDLEPGGHLHPEFTATTRNKAVNGLLNVLVRTPGRAHGVLYHALGKALEERGRQEAAALKAKAQGGTAAQYLGDKDVIEKGAAFRSEQMFQNKNKASDAVNAAAKQGGPIGEMVVNALLPFRSVPANLFSRGSEFSGGPATVGFGYARLKYLQKTGRDIMNPGKELTAAEKDAVERNTAYQIARGIVGTGLVGGGYVLAKKGALNPPDEAKFEYGSINAGRNTVDVSRLHPMALPLFTGGEMAKGKGTGAVLAGAASVLQESPYFAPAETLQNFQDGLKGKKGSFERAAGGIVGQAVPTILSQAASATDPSGHIRKKKAMLDYLKNRVPGLRETLPVSPHPEASNIKSTGPLSLLSPLSIRPKH